jgi:AraC-like DNA-binding protein
MGYRNFNAFLNRYRIDAVKQALADTMQSEVAILDIALAAGFQSLGPFNRAFKADTGMTPSEFRRNALVAGNEIGTADWPIRQNSKSA